VPENTKREALLEETMDELEIVDKIKEVVADKLDAAPTDIVEEASFIDDLGADSLDVVELIMGLEDEFGIEISDEEAENILTVGDAVRFISERQ
jgi:acyl carrier protein